MIIAMPGPKRRRKRTPLAQALYDYRTKHGLTQEAAAEKCDVATRTWINWENGYGIPSRLARAVFAERFPDLKLPD